MAMWQFHLVVLIVTCTLEFALCGSQEGCKLDLKIRKNDTFYDLTSVSGEPVRVSGRYAGRAVTVTLHLCSAGCPSGAAACVVTEANHSELVSDAGRLDNSTGLVVKDSYLELALAPGGRCSDLGQNKTFRTTILFICQSSTEDSPEPLQTNFQPCSLLVMWHTPAACPRAAAAADGCPLRAHPAYRRLTDLAALTGGVFNASDDAGARYAVRLCGGGAARDGPCRAAPVCVYGASGQARPIGDVDNGTRLSADGAAVKLTFGPRATEKAAAEVSLLCEKSAGLGRLVFRGRETDLVRFDLKTELVCPPSTVDCQVAGADGRSRDLSALARTAGNWETEDRTGARPAARFFINVCRPLNQNAAPVPCPGVYGAAVCKRDGQSAVSLGRLKDAPKLRSDGSISISYTNGSACEAGNYSSEVRLVCGAAGGEPVFQGTHGPCHDTFVWETAAACGDEESSGADCRVQDPLYGHQLDVNSLRRQDGDYALRLSANRTLFVNLCGPLRRRCGNATDQGVCLVDGKTETGYGGASSRLQHADGVLMLEMTDGADCGPAARRSTRLVFTCDQAAPAAAEPGLVQLGRCRAYLVLPTRLACHARRTASCQTPDGRYDLRGLTALTGNHKYQEADATYVLNVCHSVNPEEGVSCPADAGSCLVRPGQEDVLNRYQSLGTVSGGPAVEDGGLVIRYSGGAACADQPGRRRSSVVRFSCDRAAVGTQPRLVSSDGCVYEFSWASSHACPLEEARGAANCTVVNPQTDFRFDLSPLFRPEGYTVSDRLGHRYQLNVCSPLRQPGDCSSGAGVCKTTPVNPANKWNGGMANDRLVYDDGVLYLNYSGGSPCGGRRYSSVITFICGPEGAEPGPAVVSDDHCTVTVHWYTHLACETRVDCSVDSTAGSVDLTPLIQPNGSYHVVNPAGSGGGGGGGEFFINVCRPLGALTGHPCPPGSAACLVNGSQLLGLGHVHSGPRLKADHVTLTYEHGSPCPEDGSRNLTTELRLRCDGGGGGSSGSGSSSSSSEAGPGWPTYASCRYTFSWRTAAACPLTPAAAQAARQCRVRRPDGQMVDLNTLTARAPLEVAASGGKVRLSLCRLVEACGGAICIGNASYGGQTSFSVRPESGSLLVNYSNGSPCPTGGSPAARRGALVRLTCDPGTGRGTPMVTELTDCHVTVAWTSGAVCSTGQSDGGGAAAPAAIGFGRAVAWLLLFVVVAAGLALLVYRRGRSWDACHRVRRLLLSPGTRATAHYRRVRTDEPDEPEAALLLDDSLEDLESPQPARRRPEPAPAGMADVPLDAPTDSDDELLLI